MVPRKGVDNVIEALAVLKQKENLNARLLIVGGESDDPDPKKTPEIGRLQKKAEELGIRNSVTFVGRKTRDNLKYYFSATDVFVSTPWYEPFGITPLEAMACGAPVIGSNVGGIKYSVVDGKTGYLVPPKDPEALADKLKDVLTNQKLHAYFRKNAIDRVKEKFTWTKVAHSVAHLYEEILIPVTTTEKDKQANLDIISDAFDTAAETFYISKQVLRIPLLDAAYTIVSCLTRNNKVLICGNGGSAAQAQHMTSELVGRFLIPHRRALPAISLTADSTLLTAWSNDFSFDEVFSRQVEALGQPGDILIGLSTSGSSKNIINAFKAAKAKEMISIGLLGKGGGEAADYSDIDIVVPSHNTTRIQEVHIHVIHTICELIEKQLFAHSQPRDEEKMLHQLSQEFAETVKLS
jgi:phosphoheptose isomerase